MTTPRRELLLFGCLAGFGLLVLPALVYAVGVFLLGEYRPGATVGSFYADLYAELAAPALWAWLLVLGPWLGIQWLRLLWLPFRALLRRSVPASPGNEASPEASDI
ncbi:hypothetical protein [Thioalkalivibrio sp. XN8]|uniref:hypothetical protein n=1 Tax=Thioalkalivibrio sp. XN8 TaxID=2712863 RepID=UPI0013EAD904|nr:hypothetical protein [Thioalkalivibrio sp. XN8]NGP54367.1 hypothetical protein [Thioalkalivibrio sp. XN8]